MSGTISTGSIPRLLQEGINTVWNGTIKAFPTQFDKMFEVNTSTKAFELDVQFEGLGLGKLKDEGADIFQDSRRQGFTPKYKNLTYALGIEVTQEAMEDELYNQIKNSTASLGESMMATKETVGADVYNNGFDSNFIMPDGDGVELFSTAHVNGPSGGTYSNTLAVAADFSETSLEALLTQIGNAKNSRGISTDLAAMKLIGAVDNRFNFQRVMGSVLQSGTANNDTNAQKDLGLIRDGWMTNPFLTDADAWFITTNARVGLRYFTRRALSFGQDNSFSSGNAGFKADERYSFGWTDAHGVYGSEGSA